MRVVLVVHGYPPEDLGGTEVHTQAVAHGLAARGHDVLVLSGRTGDQAGRPSVVDELDGAVAVRRISRAARPPSTLADTWVRSQFERLLDDVRPDVVHVQHLLGLSADLIEVARARSLPTVVTLHDLWFQCPKIHPRPRDRHPFTGRGWGVACAWHHDLRHPRRMVGLAMRGELRSTLTATLHRPEVLRRQLGLADLVLAPSRFVRDAFIRFGIPPSKLLLMPHGVALARSPGRRHFRRPIRFGFVGSVVPTKGVHVLCKAFFRVGGDPTLHIHGRPHDAAYLRKIVGYLGPRIRYEGDFHPEDAGSVYGTFDVLVQPSLVDEAFGLTAAEAQASGLPVIASRVGALPERVAHEQDGILVTPGDVRELARAMARLADPQEARGFAARVRPPQPMASYVGALEDIYVGLAGARANSSNAQQAATREVAPRG